MQFHDDDAVPHLMELPPAAIRQQARQVRAILSDAGVVAEFVAPRLWEDLQFVDGAYTANDPAVRRAAIERSLRAIDVAEELQTDLIVLWLAREGTYVRESKDAVRAVAWLVEAIDRMLEYHPRIRIAIEPKPNEPMDLAYLPTTGHAVALSYRTRDPSRVGVNIESAHAILAGLDPSDEMAFALAFGKLFSVHLNDQNGLKYDQDRSFGSVDLRRAFNQVRVLDRNGYGRQGEFVGLDVKALRTQPPELATRHLANSREFFLMLLEVVRSLDEAEVDAAIRARDYEALDHLILTSLMGR
jgi:xylose isomerase